MLTTTELLPHFVAGFHRLLHPQHLLVIQGHQTRLLAEGVAS